VDINDSQERETVEPARSRADEAALELMKQLITLSSGVLALGAAFIDKLPKTPKYFLTFLFLSWVALILSLIFGLKTISAIVKSRLDSDDEWSRGKGRTFGRISQSSFLSGIGLFATFAFLSLVWPSNEGKEINITIKSDDPQIIDILKRTRGPQELPGPQGSPPENQKQDKRPAGGK
jgi:hypothetical protein